MFLRGLLSLAKVLRKAFAVAPMLTSLPARRISLIHTKSYNSISLLKNCLIIHVHVSGRIITILVTATITILITTHPTQYLLSQILLMLVRIFAIWHQHQTSSHSLSVRHYRRLL